MKRKSTPYSRVLELRKVENRKTVGSRIIAADTIRGCVFNCPGCYAAKTATRCGKDFFKPVPCEIVSDYDPTKGGGCIVRLGTFGDPCFDWHHSLRVADQFEHYYFWTKLVVPFPDLMEFQEKRQQPHPCVGVTIDVAQGAQFMLTERAAHLQLCPDYTLIFIRIYQQNDQMETLACGAKEKLERQGFKCVAVPVRLNRTEAAAFHCAAEAELSYHRNDNLGMFVCGGQGSGKCRDCNLCYHAFSGESWDKALDILSRESTRVSSSQEAPE